MEWLSSIRRTIACLEEHLLDVEELFELGGVEVKK